MSTDHSRSGLRARIAHLTILALVAGAMTLLSPSRAAADTLTESEPNGILSTADTLPIGDTVTGTTYSSTDSLDLDLFDVEVPQDGRLTLDFRGVESDSLDWSYYVSLTDGTFTLFDQFANTRPETRAWLRSQAIFVQAGTFKVFVYSESTLPAWGKRYTLKVEFTAGAAEHEPNNATANATPLPLGKTIGGSALLYGGGERDPDFYRLDVPATGPARVSLTFPSGLEGPGYDLDFHDASGATTQSIPVNATHSDGSWLARQKITLPQGTSYLSVTGEDSSETWGRPYALNVTMLLTKTPSPKITGTAAVGKTLKAKTSTWKPVTVTLKHQWLRNGKKISGATNTSYKLTKTDAGKKISVKVTGSRTGYASVTKTSKTVTARYTLTRTPKPTITGTTKVGKKLTAKAGTWKPAKVTLKYQWLRNGKKISGATKSTYTLKSADKGKKISVKVTGSKKNYLAITRASAKTRKIS